MVETQRPGNVDEQDERDERDDPALLLFEQHFRVQPVKAILKDSL